MEGSQSKMESFNYDKCVAVDLKNQTNLKMHKKGTYCKASCERRLRPPITFKEHTVFEDVHVMEPLEFIEPCANDSDSMEINPICKGKEPFDSFFSLV
jgi:hypothetical protein